MSSVSTSRIMAATSCGTVRRNQPNQAHRALGLECVHGEGRGVPAISAAQIQKRRPTLASISLCGSKRAITSCISPTDSSVSLELIELKNPKASLNSRTYRVKMRGHTEIRKVSEMLTTPLFAKGSGRFGRGERKGVGAAGLSLRRARRVEPAAPKSRPTRS